MAARMAERWYDRLSRLLDHEFSGRQPLILYAAHPHFRQTNVIPGLIGQGTGGVTEPIKRRIVLPLAGPLAETDHVLGHELVHAFQFDLLGPRLSRLPLWFVEGMAEYLSIGPIHPQTAMWIRDALQGERLPTIKQLSDPRYFPYRFGHAFWAYIAGGHGDRSIGQILKGAGGRTGGARASVVRYTQTPTDTLSARWHRAIREDYGPLRDRTGPPERDARRLLGPENAGEVNLGPALSPDGRRIAFMSEKSQFAIEIFIADVGTGEIERKITETAVDPHFESLQFINSAGAFGPRSSRLAFVGISGGDPVLSIVNVNSGQRVREVEFEELGEIFNPTWSPSGRQIAFSAIRGGLSDLYIYDLRRDSLVQLTDDPDADLHPAWSPDGRRIAFVSDRFSRDPDLLDHGRYQLALMDVESRRISAAPGFARGKHTNPQWSPDARSLYFLSDVNGITNAYRVDLQSGEFVQLTNLFTGISGITPLSPALTVASRSGALAFSVYEAGGYRVYTMESPGSLGQSSTSAIAGNPAALPPADRAESLVLALRESPERGLPADTTYPTRDYGFNLQLDRIANPSVIAGADQFGAFVGGGTAVFFSDMLGQHLLGSMLQVNGSFDDLTAALAYQNQDNRLIWGGTAERLPFIFGGFTTDTTSFQGEPAFEQRQIIFRQTNYRGVGTAWYPFNQVFRAEFSGGYRRISFEQEVRTVVVSRATGRVLADSTVESSPFDAIDLGTASAALVYDNSLFGATSPIRGQRHRFELSPMVGSLNLLEVLGDFRRYFYPVRPFTFAARLLHFGRYGGDADDPRVRDQFIGFRGLVRGYTRGSFSADECDPTPDDPCPAFNQLLGSRMAVLNAELRFPLFGVLNIGEGYYGVWPLEMALFGDAGVAWRSDDEATAVDENAFFLGGDRDPVFSAGVAFRTNLFNALVLEFDIVRAFDRKKWITQFSFLPGF